MLDTKDIETALGLTGVALTVDGGIATITANEPVTEAMQAQVRAWYVAGAVPDPAAPATPGDIAAHRYTIEQGGVNVLTSTGTHRFDTRREIEARWLKLQLAAAANPALTQGWKTLDHGFVSLTAADVLTITAAVEAHVSACFALEDQLLGNPPTLADLPAAGWPE